jgi:hypothetical protein
VTAKTGESRVFDAVRSYSLSKKQELLNREPGLVQNLPKSSGPYLLVVRHNDAGVGVIASKDYAAASLLTHRPTGPLCAASNSGLTTNPIRDSTRTSS